MVSLSAVDRKNARLALTLLRELNKIQCVRPLPSRPGRKKASVRFIEWKGGGEGSRKTGCISLCGVIAARILLDLPAAA